MGSPYSAVWMYGNTITASVGCNTFIEAVFRLYFTKPTETWAWRRLEVRT